MKPSILLDANALLRFLLNDIPKQADEVSKLFITAKTDKLTIIIPQIVIFELVFALEKFYNFPKNQVVDKLSAILTTPYLDIESVDTLQDALILYNNKNIDFVDCFLVSVATKTKCEVFTFDKKLKHLII